MMQMQSFDIEKMKAALPKCTVEKCKGKLLNLYVAQWEVGVLTTFSRLRDRKIGNEQELHYVLGDNILNMTCDMGDFKVPFFTLLLSVSLCITLLSAGLP